MASVTLLIQLSCSVPKQESPRDDQSVGASICRPTDKPLLFFCSSGNSNPHASRYSSHLYRSGCLGSSGKIVNAFFCFPLSNTAAGIRYQTSRGITYAAKKSICSSV